MRSHRSGGSRTSTAPPKATSTLTATWQAGKSRTAQAALDQVAKLGGQTVQPPVQVPGRVTFALFADPEGQVGGLVKEQ